MKSNFIKTALINSLIFLPIFLVPIIISVSIFPRLTELYANFDAELPFFTRMFISFTDFQLKYWFIIYPFLFAVNILLGFVFTLITYKIKKWKTMFSIAMALISCGLTIGFIALAVYYPIFNLTNEISENSNRVEEERFSPTSGNTAEEMYKYIIGENISTKIEKIEGDGDTWQGHSIYLKISLNDSSYVEDLLELHDYENYDCSKVLEYMELPEDWEDDLPYWDIDKVASGECYVSYGYSNKWTHSGESYFVFDIVNKVIYFKELGT